jgi:hypothetical protein
MSIEALLYLINVIGKFGDIFSVLTVISLIVSILVTVFFVINEGSNSRAESGWQRDDYINFRFISLRVLKIFVPVLVLSSVFSVIIPNEKTMYAIAFSHYAKQSEIPEKVLKAIEFKLDEVVKGVCEK